MDELETTLISGIPESNDLFVRDLFSGGSWTLKWLVRECNEQNFGLWGVGTWICTGC